MGGGGDDVAGDVAGDWTFTCWWTAGGWGDVGMADLVSC